MIYERLGEQRRRGFRADIESRALGIDALLPLVADGDQFLQGLVADLVIFRFLTVEQRMGPVRRSWRDVFGWMLDVRARHDGARGLDFNFEAEMGYVYPLLQGPFNVSHLVVSLAPELRIDSGTSRAAYMGGLSASIIGQLHLYGRWANLLRLELGAAGYSELTRLGLGYELRAGLGTEHALLEVGQAPLTLKPYAAGLLTNLTYLDEQPDTLLRWRAGLLVELPF